MWWSLSLRKGTRGCVPITEVSHSSDAWESLLQDAGKECRLNVKPWIEEEQCGFRPDRGTTDQIFTLAGVFEGAWEYNLPIHMCFFFIWRRPTTLSPGMFCGSMGSGGPFSGPSNPYILKVRAACVYLEVSQSYSKWELASAGGVPCPQSCL